MELLDFGILVLMCGVEIYFVYDLFSAYYDKRCNIQRKGMWLAGIAATVLLLLCNILPNREYSIIFCSLIIWLYSAFTFSGSLGKRVVTFIVTLLIVQGMEWLFVIIMNIDTTQYKAVLEALPTLIVLKLFTYIVLLVVKQVTGRDSKKMDQTVFMHYILLPLSSFGVMLCVFYSTSSFTTAMELFMLLFFSFLLLGNIFAYHSFFRYSEKMNDNIQQMAIARQDADMNYYRQRVKMDEEYDEFVHDTSHYLKVIGKFAASGDCEEILNIIGELDEKLEQSEMIRYSANHILNAVLSDKRSVAEAEGIHFDVYLEPGLRLNMISDTDLIVILGNLLDNALRAARECNAEKYVKVRIFMQNNNRLAVIKVVNGYEGSIYRGKRGFISTKKKNGLHGLGLKSVRRKAESYGGCLQCNADNGVFEAVAILSAGE